MRVIHGLTKMGVLLDEPWLQRFYNRVEAAPGSFQVSGFGMVVWALAKAGAKPHPAWMIALLESTYGWGDDALGDGCNSSDGGEVQAVAGVYQQLRPQHLANMLCAFAKLGFTPGARWMSWFRAELDRTSGGQLQELDHFHIEWAWLELNHQYRLAAAGSSGGSSGSMGSAGTVGDATDP